MARHPAPAFAAVLEQLREARGLSPADLARKLDVSPTQVSRWRRGLDVPSIERIEDIALFFGIERESLERLAGYRANTVAGEQDTIDPGMAAMFEAERADLKDQLRDIPEPFWRVILDAQRSARRVAVDGVKAAIGLAQAQPISTPESQPISNVSDAPGRDRNKGARGPKRGLTGTYAFGAAHEQSANALALATA